MQLEFLRHVISNLNGHFTILEQMHKENIGQQTPIACSKHGLSQMVWSSNSNE